jgi:hypothetical protein
MNFEIRTSVVNGRLKRNSNLIADALNFYEGKEIIIKIEKAKKKRSNPQNSYYWGVIIPIIQNCLKDSGNLLSNDNTHELLRLKFLKITILANEDTGEFIERIKSTTELTTSQFMDYIAEIQQFAAEYFGVTIPNPNDDLKLNFND